MDIKRALMDSKILKENHYKLTSGKHAKIYVSKTKITTVPMLYTAVITQFVNQIMNDFYKEEYDVITGPAVAGICFAAPVALNLGKAFVYPEKKVLPLPERTQNGIEDTIMEFRSDFTEGIKGKKIIIIEDIITTGTSVVKTIQSIINYGGEVVKIYCIWNRDPDLVIWNNLKDRKETPIKGLVEERIDSWGHGEVCPLCKDNIPLLDPKTDKVIK